jgi:two-component system sensor histidine kinase ChiS
LRDLIPRAIKIQTAFLILSFPLILLSDNYNIKFERISIEQGLSYNEVTYFLQDRKGFIWIGTQDGLNKYDGYKFTVYRHNTNDITSTSCHRIWSIFEDDSGIIWIGTLDGGLNRFNPDNKQFTYYMNDLNDPNSISINVIWSIYEDKSGTLWIETGEVV